MMANIDMKQVEKVAEKFQMDIEQVLDLLDEGFTIEEAEEIIEAAEM